MQANRLLLAACALAALLAKTSAQTTRIQILHASDLEGGVDAIADAPNFAAVVEALEKRASTANLPSVLLSSGDNYIPGPFFSAAADPALRSVIRTALQNPTAREGDGRVDISIMNVCAFDAAAIGNHEFDNGTGTFGELLGTDIRSATDVRWLGTQFPYLSCNLDFSQEAGLARLYTDKLLASTEFQSPLNDLVKAAAAPKIANATIIRRGNVTIGVVGATTPLVTTISSTGKVLVRGSATNDMAKLAAVIQPNIDALRNLGVDKIVLVTHLQQFALEQALTPLLSGVDIVIAGGSDTLLADATDRLRVGDRAAGPYPFVSQNKDKEPVLIVSTDGQYSYVGSLVVDFDANGVLVPASINQNESGAFATDDQGVVALWGSLQNAFAPGTKGATVKSLTDAVNQVVTVRDGNIVGKASVWLEGRRTSVRTEETNFGVLTAEANLAAAKSFDSTVLVSHKNGGGIRNPIGSIDGITGELGPNAPNPITGKKAGEISQLDIENTLRFNNGLSLLTLTRAQFKQVLEHAVAATGAGATPGQFGQFAGVSFSFDVSRQAGDRVRFACLTDKAVSDPIVVDNGQVVGTSTIRIVTLDFLAGGGDAYPFPSFQNTNRVDLRSANLPDGKSTFAPAGSEQDALAEFLLDKFSTLPYANADTKVGDDQLVQQSGTRPSMTTTRPSATQQNFAIRNAGANALVLFVVGSRASSEQVDFGPLGRVVYGVEPLLILPITATNAAGNADVMAQRSASATGVVQAMIVDMLSTSGIEISTTETVAF